MHSGVYFKKLQGRVEAPKKSILGRKMNFHFCPNCGGFVCWNADIRPDQYGMAVGAFADPNFPPPTYSVWEESTLFRRLLLRKRGPFGAACVKPPLYLPCPS